MPGDLCTAPRIISLSPLSLATDVTDATLGASGLWLGTRTGAGGTAKLTESFFLATAHGSMDNRTAVKIIGTSSYFFPGNYPNFSSQSMIPRTTETVEIRPDLFLLSPPLTFFLTILLTTFGDKEPHLRR